MPTTWWTYMIGALALAGIFPLAGFWSKDEIIAHAFDVQNVRSTGILLIFASLITAFYMGRQVALIFYGKQRDHDLPRPRERPGDAPAAGGAGGRHGARRR